MTEQPIQSNYQHLWDTMVILHPATAKALAAKAIANQATYEKVSNFTGVPWYFIACVHYREASFSFTRHLHNGDPLARKTVHVPKGRPVAPPVNGPKAAYTWSESAIDVLQMLGLDKIEHWTMETILREFEKYNGMGYQRHRPGVLSPYLWAGTNHYKKGKYASDGKFDAELVDQQLGCAPLLRYITDKTLA